MSDDERLHQRLLEQAKAYSRLYPSIGPRLKAALDGGDPSLRELVRAMTEALERSDRQRERQLQDGWGLSPQETRVALHLIDGGDGRHLRRTARRGGEYHPHAFEVGFREDRRQSAGATAGVAEE